MNPSCESSCKPKNVKHVVGRSSLFVATGTPRSLHMLNAFARFSSHSDGCRRPKNRKLSKLCMPAVMPWQDIIHISASAIEENILGPSASQKVKLGRGTPCLYTIFPRDDDRLGERGYADMRSVHQALPS